MQSNTRIAKNTGLLYFRMIVTILLSLYTSRIVLQSLGASDFGIYNIVGGVVAILGFLNATMIASTNRFLAFELGRGDFEKLKNTFSLTLTIHLMIAVVVLVILETIGLWFLNNRLNIPIDRMNAANWVYQISIFTAILGIIQVPYQASIIAHEKMGIYAFLTIFNVGFKLLLIFLLLYTDYDKLVLYAMLLAIVQIITFVVLVVVCRRSFKETEYHFYWNRGLFREIFSFSIWNFYGQFVIIINEQVLAILLNLFFGTLVNAASGIASRLNSVIFNFAANFQMALNPAITKSYAGEQLEGMQKLLFRGSKFSFYLMFLLSLPVLFEMKFLLTFWLGEIPEYTVEFCRLVIINSLIDTLIGPIETTVNATGKVRQYKLVVYSIVFTILPISYILLYLGVKPYVIIYVQIANTIVTLLVRLYFVKRIVGLKLSDYFSLVVKPIIVVVLTTIILPVLVYHNMKAGTLHFFVLVPVSLFSVVSGIFAIGLSVSERSFLLNSAVKAISDLQQKLR